MSVQVSYSKQFTLGIFFLIIIFAALEGSSRTYEIFNPDCTFLEKDAFEKVDYFTTRIICQDLNTTLYETFSEIAVVSPNQHKDTLNINSHGFRGPDISKEKPDDTYRIFTIGGSTMYGYGSTSDKTTIAGYLQQEFENTNLGMNIEVINAGIPAADSYSESIFIKNKLIEFQPDLFIVYDGWNDLDHEIIEVSDTQSKKSDEDDSGFKFKNFPFYRTPFVIWKILYSSSSHWDNYMIDESKTDKKVELWTERWNDICHLGKNKNFDTIVTIQPMLGTGNKILSHDESLLAPYLDEHFAIIRGLEKMESHLSQLDKNCIKTASLKNIFDGIDKPIFYDIGHTNDYGNELVAKKLFEISLPVISDKKY